MRAIVYERYGTPDVLELREVDKPAVEDDAVLVHVRAASVNPLDWHFVTGTPYFTRLVVGLRRPKDGVVGVDFAGTVEAVGKDVEHVRPRDEVFGGRSGAFAEYVAVKEAVVVKPAGVSFEDAAAVPIAGVTALQGLRDKGGLQAGQRVLVNGASGGVGTFAVQIAKALGAEVTAVCSPQNVETARSLGADRVIDYTQEDFTRDGRRYDVMFDVPGNRSWSDCKRVLVDRGTYVLAGGPKHNRWIGPVGMAIGRQLLSKIGSRRAVKFLAKLNREDLRFLGDLLADGRVKPVIDRRYPLEEVPDALSYLGEGHARGKIVITVP
jgi:NADPH:quinone reductase-like Zn-dependent oxidoreductase